MSPGARPPVSVLGLVALGGAIGALLREALTSALPDPSGGFPWTVFAVNVVGCLLLGLVPGLGPVRRHHALRPLLGPGLLGGFTTLSAYAEQTRALVAGGHTPLATVYVVGTLASALLAFATGEHLAARAAGEGVR